MESIASAASELLNATAERWRRCRKGIKYWFNRVRSSYKLSKGTSGFKILMPLRHRPIIRAGKYIFGAIGLLLGLITFGSIFTGFMAGLVLFLICYLLEKISFIHEYLFVHPLPDFDLDGKKWVGMGFGYFSHPLTGDIPVISMLVTDEEYAANLSRLFLSWSGGVARDDQKNIKIRIAVTGPTEYIFFIYPHPERRPLSQFTQSARDKLKEESLTDEISVTQASVILGKRCHIGPDSFFQEFRRTFGDMGTVLFDFSVPPYDGRVRDIPGVTRFTLFEVEILDKASLKREDILHDLIDNHRGGEWLGPPHLNPDIKAA